MAIDELKSRHTLRAGVSGVPVTASNLTGAFKETEAEGADSTLASVVSGAPSGMLSAVPFFCEIETRDAFETTVLVADFAVRNIRALVVNHAADSSDGLIVILAGLTCS